MQESIDDLEALFARWQKNPDVSQTVAMCDALRGSKRADLVEIVGGYASRQLDVPVLTATARMYTDTGRLDDAQQVLLAAGRLAPRDGDVFRGLGEVLLRRGDAERAEKVLERALELGSQDPGAGAWLDRARALVPMQLSRGMNDVAQEIARSAPTTSAPAAGAIRARPRSSPDDEIDTLIRNNDEVKAALVARGHAPVPAAGVPARVERVAHEVPQTSGMPFPAEARAAESALPLRAPPPELTVNPLLVAPRAPRPMGPGGRAMPEARDVLDALQIAGVYEPEGAVRPHGFGWDRPDKGKRRVGSFAVLISLAVAIVAGAGGTYRYVNDKRARQHVAAEELLTRVDADLRASEVRLLEPSEQAIARSFDLESRSPHAALTWLHERALRGLLQGGEDVAFEDGTSRAKEVGLEDKRLAFAHVASFLFQGDTAGAASALAKWDGKAEEDAFYQLVAGATFERAGDNRALERYAAAVKLDPELVVAQLLLARVTAVDGDARRAAELARDFRAKYPDRIEGTALAALAWARDPMHRDPPEEARTIADKFEVLPAPLKAVAPAVRALLALEEHKTEEAKAALQKGLGVADTPGIAAWLGGIALATGDEALARKGALIAVSFSAVYPPARILAARVALLGARLDEALKASEELPAASPDVAVVTAAVAYERLDGERMSRALDAMPEDAKKLPFLVPLLRGQALMSGNAKALTADKAAAMADDETPWADLVAMDSALETGDLELAHKVAARWPGDAKATGALRAVRLAKLARWDGKNDEAEHLSRIALEGGTVTVRALAERVFVLVAMGKAPEAIALFKAYPNVGGPLAKWLRAYAVASHGKVEEARAIVSQEDPPPSLAPLPSRLIAAAAYGAMKDTRHGSDYVKSIVQAGFANPDLAAAAEKVGVGKLARRR